MLLRTYLFAKIHGIRLTDKNVRYEGSITLSRDLVDAAGLQPFEAVQVVNVNSGARLTTYVIVTNEPGVCVLNGGAARLAEVGDPLLVMAFAHSPEPLQPRIVLVDERNAIREVTGGRR